MARLTPPSLSFAASLRGAPARPDRRRACAVLGALAASRAHAAPALRILTEEYPPYNFTQDGVVTGLGTEVVEAVLAQLGMRAAIQSLPWARAYETAQAEENVLIYSINRSPERERLFKWVGVVTPSDYYLFALRSRHLRLASLEQAKTLQVGTVKQDIGEQRLLAQGFTAGGNLQSGPRYDLNYQKLKAGRIDLWVMNELGARWIARQAGDDPDQTLERVLRLPDQGAGGNYMAFGTRTADSLVERFRAGLAALHRNGTYEALHRKWLL